MKNYRFDRSNHSKGGAGGAALEENQQSPPGSGPN